MAGPSDELVFAPLGGVGEIGMNLAIYGLGDERRRQWIVVDLGVAFAGDDLPGRRSHPAGHPLPGRGAPQPPRPRAHPRARGSFRRADRPVAAAQAAGLRDAVHRRAARGQAPGRARRARHPGQHRAARRPLHARAVRHRIRLDGAFDPGIERPDHPHAARHRAAHRRLEDRSDAGDRPADRRGEAARARRRGLPRADRRFHQCGARGPLAVGERRRQDRSPN